MDINDIRLDYWGTDYLKGAKVSPDRFYLTNHKGGKTYLYNIEI